MAAFQFHDRVALVTGGGSGIGEACVRLLAEGGAQVVVADMDMANGERVAASINTDGGSARFISVNVTQPAEVQALVVQTVEAFGRLDIAVNNAGVGGAQAATGEYSIEAWQQVIDVNFNGVFYCMRYEIAHMLNNNGGAIVNMASVLGTVGFATAPAYVAAKHGVVGLTKNAALEYAAQGIRINAVGPGFIETPLLTKHLDAAAKQAVAGLHPIGRLGQPHEVAALVAFLCSEHASFMTGGYYVVDGAYTAQ